MRLLRYVNPTSAYLMLAAVLLIDLIAVLTGFLIITVLPLLALATFVAAFGGYAHLARSEDRIGAVVRSTLVGSAGFLVLYYLYRTNNPGEIGVIWSTLLKTWLARLAGGSLVGCVVCWGALLFRKRDRTLTLLAALLSSAASFVVVRSLGPILERPDGWPLLNLLVVLGLGVHLLFGGFTRPAFRLFERKLPEPQPEPIPPLEPDRPQAPPEG